MDDQSTTLEATAAALSHDLPSLTEPPVASEINLPTSVEGVSPEESLIATTATLVESSLVSEEQEYTSIEIRDVEPAPVLEGQTKELIEVGADSIREEPKVDEETQATDSHPDVGDGVGNDIAPSQELVSDVQFAVPTSIPGAELNEDVTPILAVESVLASASPVIEHLPIPEAEEFKIFETVKEVEATGDKDSQTITSEELITEAEANVPLVDLVIPAPDIGAACDFETTETPAEEPSASGAGTLTTEAEAEMVEDPIAEINESTSLQVEESQIAELEPVLVDASPIDGESVTQKLPTIEAEDVEPVAKGDAVVENAQHEESTLSYDVQEEVVPKPNSADDSGALESHESIGAEEPNIPADIPLIGPSEDATTVDDVMSSEQLKAVASEEDIPAISTLIAEDSPVEESSTAGHGRFKNVFIQIKLLKIQHLVVPDAEESKTLEEVEAAGDEDSQPIISEELVTEAEPDLVDLVVPAPHITPACDSETTETPAEEPSAPGVENLSTEAEAETVEDLVLPQDPITEINEPTSLQVEESQIVELESVLVDASPIEVESVTQEAPTVEAENVELMPNTPPFEEPVVTEGALVEDAQHEELTLSHDVQEEVVPEVNPIDDAGALQSQESIGAEESDTSPIVEENSAPVVENQLVDKGVPSNESAVEDSKIEVDEPIVIDAPIVEDSPTVVETPFETTVSVLVPPSVADEPEFIVDADIAEGTTSSFLYDVNIFDLKCSDSGSALELTGESEALTTGGEIDPTISEVLEVSKGDLDFLVYLSVILTSIPRFR